MTQKRRWTTFLRPGGSLTLNTPGHQTWKTLETTAKLASGKAYRAEGCNPGLRNKTEEKGGVGNLPTPLIFVADSTSETTPYGPVGISSAAAPLGPFTTGIVWRLLVPPVIFNP